MIKEDITQITKGKTRNNMVVFSASGSVLSKIPYENKLLGFSWSSDERLFCIAEDATVQVFDIWGEAFQFSLGREVNESGIVDVKFWDDGFVVLTSAFQFVAYSNSTDSRPKFLADASI